MGVTDAIFGHHIKRLRAELRLTSREFARKLDVSAESVSRWENGKARPRQDRIEKMIALAPSFKELLTAARAPVIEAPGVEELESGHVALRIVDVRVSAEDGRASLVEEEKGRWLFPAEHYRRLVRHAPAHTVVVFVDGDSMLPTLAPNAPLLVLTRKPQPRVDGIWVLRQRDLLMVKRLHFSFENPAKVTVISDNPRYPQEQLTVEEDQPDFDLVGRVIGGITSY